MTSDSAQSKFARIFARTFPRLTEKSWPISQGLRSLDRICIDIGSISHGQAALAKIHLVLKFVLHLVESPTGIGIAEGTIRREKKRTCFSVCAKLNQQFSTRLMINELSQYCVVCYSGWRILQNWCSFFSQ